MGRKVLLSPKSKVDMKTACGKRDVEKKKRLPKKGNLGRLERRSPRGGSLRETCPFNCGGTIHRKDPPESRKKKKKKVILQGDRSNGEPEREVNKRERNVESIEHRGGKKRMTM